MSRVKTSLKRHLGVHVRPRPGGAGDLPRQAPPDRALRLAGRAAGPQCPGTHSGGKRRSSSILPRKPKSVRICSELALGDTLVTWITSVPPPGPPLGPGPGPAALGTTAVLLMARAASCSTHQTHDSESARHRPPAAHKRPPTSRSAAGPQCYAPALQPAPAPRARKYAASSCSRNSPGWAHPAVPPQKWFLRTPHSTRSIFRQNPFTWPLRPPVKAV